MATSQEVPQNDLFFWRQPLMNYCKAMQEGSRMFAQAEERRILSIPNTLKVIGISTAALGLLGTLLAVIAYAQDHPGFSIFTTYLSDIGDTPGWPQVFLNNSIVLISPLRYLVLVLLVMCLAEFGAGRLFMTSILTVGAFTTLGTVLMTAIPFSFAPSVHKIGIAFYFLGVVILQLMIGIREWQLKSIPHLLPILSFLMVAVYMVFATLMMLYEGGMVSRNTPVIWEWMCFAVSILWVLGQSIVLGDEKQMT
jgi:hypothetical membrane protein